MGFLKKEISPRKTAPLGRALFDRLSMLLCLCESDMGETPLFEYIPHISMAAAYK